MDEIFNTKTLPDEADVTSSVGGVSDGNAASDVVEVKDLLGQHLGKKFDTNESALKSVKDTFSYIGEYGKVKPLIEKLGGVDNVIKKLMDESTQPVPASQEQVQQPQPVPQGPDVAALAQQVKDMQFYEAHPELKAHKDVIASMGSDPEKVVESEAFKKVSEALKARDESDASKSVVMSNSRVQEVASDYQTDLDNAIKKGNWVDFLEKHKGIKLE